MARRADTRAPRRERTAFGGAREKRRAAPANGPRKGPRRPAVRSAAAIDEVEQRVVDRPPAGGDHADLHLPAGDDQPSFRIASSAREPRRAQIRLTATINRIMVEDSEGKRGLPDTARTLICSFAAFRHEDVRGPIARAFADENLRNGLASPVIQRRAARSNPRLCAFSAARCSILLLCRRRFSTRSTEPGGSSSQVISSTRRAPRNSPLQRQACQGAQRSEPRGCVSAARVRRAEGQRQTNTGRVGTRAHVSRGDRKSTRAVEAKKDLSAAVAILQLVLHRRDSSKAMSAPRASAALPR